VRGEHLAQGRTELATASAVAVSIAMVVTCVV
jgi:hypothetical protein